MWANGFRERPLDMAALLKAVAVVTDKLLFPAPIFDSCPCKNHRKNPWIFLEL